MKVTGRCHCGQISFEAEIDPTQVRICHCTDCQTLTGTAFRTTVLLPGRNAPCMVAAIVTVSSFAITEA